MDNLCKLSDHGIGEHLRGHPQSLPAHLAARGTHLGGGFHCFKDRVKLKALTNLSRLGGSKSIHDSDRVDPACGTLKMGTKKFLGSRRVGDRAGLNICLEAEGMRVSARRK
ncbi:MAG: hypothetical protein WAU33_18640 [Candidatus Binataceae bacterium]